MQSILETRNIINEGVKIKDLEQGVRLKIYGSIEDFDEDDDDVLNVFSLLIETNEGKGPALISSLNMDELEFFAKSIIVQIELIRNNYSKEINSLPIYKRQKI